MAKSSPAARGQAALRLPGPPARCCHGEPLARCCRRRLLVLLLSFSFFFGLERNTILFSRARTSCPDGVSALCRRPAGRLTYFLAFHFPLPTSRCSYSFLSFSCVCVCVVRSLSGHVLHESRMYVDILRHDVLLPPVIRERPRRRRAIMRRPTYLKKEGSRGAAASAQGALNT